jgi:hypothetical protein
MALFVHLASEKHSAAIARDGIKARRCRVPRAEGFERVVFAMPVTENYFVSHQWLRELKRQGQRTLVGVYFRIPDEQRVLVGHYNRRHEERTAAEAIGELFQANEPEGYEVLIPRKIAAAEIHRIAPVSQVTGWRYFPGAHNRAPCGCPACLGRGEIKSKRIREAYQREGEDGQL